MVESRPCAYTYADTCPFSNSELMTPAEARILVVDDNEDILQAARLLLKRHFASVQTLSDPAHLATLA